MFLGCSPCCGGCPSYNIQPFTTNPDHISNIYLDVTVRASVSAFVNQFQQSFPAADSGLVSASGWLFPALTSPLIQGLSGIPFYDVTISNVRYVSFLDFNAGLQSITGGLSSILGLGLVPQLYTPLGTATVENFLPRYNTITFSPCQVSNIGDGAGVGDPEYGVFDVIVETLDTRSAAFFSSHNSTEFTLSAGAVDINETLANTNNWIRDGNNNPIICHRFSGGPKKTAAVMDGETHLVATWFFEDLELPSGTVASSFLEFTCREFLVEFGDGKTEPALPFWTDSLETFSS